MEASRKRRIRFTVALSLACMLSAALVYVSFSAASETKTPSQLLAAAKPGEQYELTGKVQKGSIKREGTKWQFRVEDRTGGGASVPVRYTGAMPDPFREGREVIVDVRAQNGTFVASKVVTKCPSKFTADKQSS